MGKKSNSDKEESPERQLWRLILGLGAIYEAEDQLGFLEEVVGNEGIERALWSSYFVTYAKPFTKNNELGSLKQRLVPHEYRDMHRKILRIRNEVYGHIDPSARLDAGNVVHKVQLRIVDGKILPNPTFIRPAPSEIPVFMEFTAAVKEQIEQAIQEICVNNENFSLADNGNYQLDPRDSQPFRRIDT